MTGRTHDLAALTTLTLVVATQPLPTISIATLYTTVGANLIGAVAPDLDQPAGKFWKKFPAGTILGKILNPFFGAHRSISHSLVGIFLFAVISNEVLKYISTFLFVDIQIVWISFMLGVLSHIFADMFTKQGVPLLFPFSTKFGIPPIRKLRITTGKIIESSIIFPMLLLLNAFIIYSRYEVFWDFIRNHLTK